MIYPFVCILLLTALLLALIALCRVSKKNKSLKERMEILHTMLEETARREEIARIIIKELRQREARRKQYTDAVC